MKYIFHITFLFFLTLIFSVNAESQNVLKQDFYENGKLKQSVYEIAGTYYILDYYENGKIKEQKCYSEKKRDGTFSAWHENGKKQAEITFSKDVPNGKWIIWNDTGKVVGTASYKRGILEAGSQWDDQGKLIAYK